MRVRGEFIYSCNHSIYREATEFARDPSKNHEPATQAPVIRLFAARRTNCKLATGGAWRSQGAISTDLMAACLSPIKLCSLRSVNFGKARFSRRELVQRNTPKLRRKRVARTQRFGFARIRFYRAGSIPVTCGVLFATEHREKQPCHRRHEEHDPVRAKSMQRFFTG
jgi:hypothetical protein